jgi:hypothetical protein
MDTNTVQDLNPIVNSLPTTWQTHWPALMFASAALTHFAHMAWPSIKTAWPYIASHGGVRGIIKTFLYGDSIPIEKMLTNASDALNKPTP